MEVSIEGYLLTQLCGSLCLLAALSLTLTERLPDLRRLLAAALLESAVALLCVVQPMGRVAGAVLLGLAAPVWVLPKMPLRHRLRACVLHLTLSLLLLGTGRALQSFGAPASLSAWLAAVCMLLTPRLRVRCAPLPLRQVEVTRQGRTVCLSAMVDSGNLVRDAVTGLPVIVCSARALERLVPRGLPGTLPEGFRLLSIRTASGTALMPVFRPDRVRLHTAEGFTDVGALIGMAVSGYSGFQALVPASLAAHRPEAGGATPGGLPFRPKEEGT